MYILVVYDVSVERVGKVHKMLKRYLNWRQNSVFEVELTETQIEAVKQNLGNIIVKETDFILFYIARDEKWLRREEMGNQRGTTANFL